MCVILFTAEALGLGTNMHQKGTKTRSVHRSGPMIRERAELAVPNRGSRIQRFSLAATKAGSGLRNLCRVGQTERDRHRADWKQSK